MSYLLLYSVIVKEPFTHTTCGVCLMPYNDPRILACLHSFCQQCLHHVIEKSGSQQVFKCPTCERNMSIPVGGATVLPQNLHLGFQVEVARYVSKIVSNSEVCCEECIDGSSRQASVFCCKCCQFLCKLCYDYHRSSRRLSNHNMVQLDPEGAKQLQTMMKPKELYCSQPNHEDYKMSFYCETCNCLVCLYCMTLAHKDHGLTELSAVAKTYQREIRGALEDADVAVAKLIGTMDGNDKIIDDVEISKRNAILAINQAFEILQQTLEERKKTLLTEVEAISLSKTTALTLQKEQFEKIVEDIGYYTEMTSHIIQTHTDHELVSLGALTPTELKATLNKVQTMSLTPNQHSYISLSVQMDDLIRELSRFGDVSELPPSTSSSPLTPTSAAKVGTMFPVMVRSKTSKGKGYTHGGVQAVCGEVEDHMVLTPQTAGPQKLVITTDGQHVQNSLHDLTGRPKCDYLTLHNLQQVIECSSPLCVAIHDNGDIYVGSGDHCIYVFDRTGQLKNTIGCDGSGNGQFNTPYGISIKGDLLYVADFWNHRIQKLTSRGEFLDTFGQQGSGQGQFDGPFAVVVDSNNRLIVSDTNNHRIQIFNQYGGWLRTIDGKGFGNDCLQKPCGLALDSQGNIHVASIGSYTIKVFTKEGVYDRSYGDPKGPIGLAINNEGNSLICGHYCLSIIDPQGNSIYNMRNAYGITLHPGDDNVYVANCGANSVFKYSI